MQKRQSATWDLQSVPTFWINHASRALMFRFEERLRPLGFSMPYLRVAMALEKHGPLQQKDLLAHVAIEQPTMAALLTRMERDRLLARKPDPADARARLVSLTTRGTAGLAKAKQALPAVADRALVGVTREDQAKLMKMLQLIVANLTDDDVASSHSTRSRE